MMSCLCPCWRKSPPPPTILPPTRQDVTTQTEKILPTIQLSDTSVSITIEPVIDREIMTDEEYEHV